MSRIAIASLLALVTACSGAEPTVALFELPRDGVTESGFYALPFPNDLRRRADGTIDLDEHLRPNDFIGQYLDIFSSRLTGFSTVGAIFVRFDGAIDEAALPATPADSALASASVYLVDVDPGSPERGQRTPLSFKFESHTGESIGPNRLAALPHPGFPLRSLTTYALVVTERLGVQASPDMRAVLSTGDDADDAVTRARAAYAPLLDYLDEAGDDERDDVAAAAVFTTQDATSMMGRVRDVIHRDVAAPTARDVELIFSDESLLIYEGVYDGPSFQTGEPPFRQLGDGGEIVTDENGDPIVQRMEEIRFAVSVPAGPTPAEGWPIVVYSHGTGGDYRSFIADQTAARMGAQGLAVIGYDATLHGTRNPQGAPAEDVFYNWLNPVAGRDNNRQAAIDNFQIVRLAHSLTAGDATFDADRISFMGHSQGGVSGPLFLAYEPDVTGAVLSGAGGVLYLSFLYKQGAIDLVSAILRDYPLDEYNNIFALVQMFTDVTDPINYGRLLIREPVDGVDAKDIYQSEGFEDEWTPALTSEALGVAIGLSPVEPVLRPVDGFAMRDIEVLQAPVEGNMAGNTGVFLQYDSAPGDSGHFVVFDVEAAQRQHAAFLGSLARDGRATLVP